MSLSDQIVSDVGDVFLQTDDFAEAITYFPKEGASRSINATRVSLSHYRRQPERMTDEEQHHQRQRNELAFLVSNDETTGIPNPRLGDSIRLSTDPTDERWGFVSIEESDIGGFVVAWCKSVPLRSGQIRPPRL